jgi:hypothetical protein
MNPWYWTYNEPSRSRIEQSHHAEMRRVNRNKLRESTFAGRVYFHCERCGAGFLRRIDAVKHCRKASDK